MESKGINHWQIKNTECQNCGNTTLQISENQGRQVECQICHTEFAVVNFGDKFSLIKLEG